jgi:aerobic-type carbon monoxide dehydrogenase small subunit (CoxS/CutS family)
MRIPISFTLNGKPSRLVVDPSRPLLWVLRDDVGMTGTKYGCGEGHCGSCTVLVDDRAVRSCIATIGEVAGKRLTTIEGLATGDRLHPIQQAFADHGAFQCGYCTPGMILGAYAFLRKNPKATRAEIVRHMDSHLCRCGAHVRIVSAMETAVAAMKGGTR